MSEPKFTTGPWVCRRVIPELGGGFIIHEDENRHSICHIPKYYENGIANAGLITAAPELYAECKRAEEICTAFYDFMVEKGVFGARGILETRDRIRAILLKVNGEV